MKDVAFLFRTYVVKYDFMILAQFRELHLCLLKSDFRFSSGADSFSHAFFYKYN
jgi:hypothetical protein